MKALYTDNYRNCPNCAAPYDVELNKCPYCGTSYFDLAAVQLMGEPVSLKIKLGIGDRSVIQTVKATLVNVSEEYSYGECARSILDFDLQPMRLPGGKVTLTFIHE